MDLNKMVMNSLENMQSGGKVQEIVDKHVAKTIESIVEDKHGLKYIYIDTEQDVKWYQCKYKIVLDKDLTVSRAEIGDKSFDNKVIMGGLYGADATIFKMWTRKSKLVIDSYDTSFTNPEYD